MAAFGQRDKVMKGLFSDRAKVTMARMARSISSGDPSTTKLWALTMSPGLVNWKSAWMVRAVNGFEQSAPPPLRTAVKEPVKESDRGVHVMVSAGQRSGWQRGPKSPRRLR